MSFRSKIKNYLPYSFVLSYMQRHKTKFVFGNNSVTDEDVHYDDKSAYKTVVSVEGFGYSGSGAVVDLLREYDELLVMGSIDAQEGSLAKSDNLSEEMDFIRLTGGLFEIEKYIEGNNAFFNDAVIHRLIKLVQSSSVFAYNEKARLLFGKFFANIVEFKIDGLPVPMYNTYLEDTDNTIYYLKSMTINEYRLLCRQLITSIFNCYKRTGKEVLVADQLFSDGEFDVVRNEQYVPNLKTIVIYRDPRDVFAFAFKRKVSWIPYNDVNTYIKWVKTNYKRFDKTRSDYLVIRYEDLISNYDVEVKKIEQYLDIERHTSPRSCFDPSVSCRNVGIWKDSELDISVFEAIKEEFPELCE